MMMLTTLVVGAFAVLYYMHQQMKEKDNQIQMILKQMEELKTKLTDPDHGKMIAKLAFDDAEEWRAHTVRQLYENVTDDELDNAARWIAHAEPFAGDRGCLSVKYNNDTMKSFIESAFLLASPEFHWNETCRKSSLALHAYHTTGIEGNTLTLTETFLIINNTPLLAGFRDDHLFTPVTQTSLKEVNNIRHIFDALKLAQPPGKFKVDFNAQTLVDINAAITRDLNTPSGYRRHAVAVGHQKIILPMPDEVPFLMEKYMKWLNESVQSLRDDLDVNVSKGRQLEDVIFRGVSFACDAHTRLVHIHPFADGNGRLARIVSGLVLNVVGLPMPLFLKDRREEYIRAVGNATIRRNYTSICTLHAEAVNRAAKEMVRLATNGCSMN